MQEAQLFEIKCKICGSKKVVISQEPYGSYLKDKVVIVKCRECQAKEEIVCSC